MRKHPPDAGPIIIISGTEDGAPVGTTQSGPSTSEDFQAVVTFVRSQMSIPANVTTATDQIAAYLATL